MPRLGYTKSRNGCMRCRQRRVKCDEKRPCAACVRHNVRCSLLDNPPPGAVQRELPKRDRDRAVSISSASPESSAASVITTDPRRSLPDFNRSPSSTLVARTPTELNELPTSSVSAYPDLDGFQVQSATPTSTAEDPFPYFDKFMLPIGIEREAAWVQDLELMHHYSVITSPTLPRAQDELHVWQQQVPKLAFQYPFLVHQMLAVAAFHKAYLEPERHGEHSLRASQHQNRSIEGVRALLADITAENCHALFMASSLLLVGAFGSFANAKATASPLLGGQRPPTIEDMIDVFILDRGVASVLQSSEPTIQAGYFRDLFHFKALKRVNPFMQQVAKELRSLGAQINQDESLGRMVRILVNIEITKLIDAVEKAVVTTEEAEMRVTTYWPITIAEDYITLLRQRNEVALLVIIFYCSVVHRAEATVWFLKGWGTSVAADVDKLISPKWRAAVKWPLEELKKPSQPTT